MELPPRGLEIKVLASHDAAFKSCETTINAQSSSINQAVTSSVTAFKTAQSAMTMLQGFQSTGTVGKINAHEQTIAGLQGEVAFLKSELAGVCSLVHSVIKQLPSGTQGSAEGASAEVPQLKKEIASLRDHTASQIRTMKQSIDGSGPYTLGSYKFDGITSCAAQLAQWGVTTNVFEYLFDPSHLLTALMNRTKTHEQVEKQAVLAEKTKISASQLTAMASFEALIPEILTGSAKAAPATSDSQLTATFAQIRTFEQFDGGDGESGIRNFVFTGLRDFLPQQQMEAEALFSREYPSFFTVLGTLRDRSAAALEDLFKECNSGRLREGQLW